MVDDFALTGRELPDGVVLIRSGQGSDLRRAHLLPSELVTFATGPEVQANGPRVKSFRGEEALLTASSSRSPTPSRLTVCYTQGHGEPAFDDLEPFNGYAHLRDLLRDANLETQIADLADDDGARALRRAVDRRAQGHAPARRGRAIRRFAEHGKDILILAGAELVRNKPMLADHGLEPLTADYGIHFGDRIVLDDHAVPGGSELLGFTVLDGWADHRGGPQPRAPARRVLRGPRAVDRPRGRGPGLDLRGRAGPSR